MWALFEKVRQLATYTEILTKAPLSNVVQAAVASPMKKPQRYAGDPVSTTGIRAVAVRTSAAAPLGLGTVPVPVRVQVCVALS